MYKNLHEKSAKFTREFYKWKIDINGKQIGFLFYPFDVWMTGWLFMSYSKKYGDRSNHLN